MNILYAILTAASAFLLGSVPTAYLLVKSRSGADIRQEGSGNVGAMNAFEVTRSRHLGIGIFLLDFLKGALCVVGARWIFADAYAYATIAFLSAVIGHNYSPWIGFKGGRGLASAAGGSMLLNPLYLIYWGAFWVAAYLLRRDIILGNVAATVLSPVLLIITPGLARSFMLVSTDHPFDPVLPGIAVCIIILLRHIGPIRELARERASGSDKRRTN